MNRTLATVAVIFAIIAGVWGAGEIFATDEELKAATALVASTHKRDQLTNAQAIKNMRLDDMDKQITNQMRVLEFDVMTTKQSTFEQTVLDGLTLKRQNIVEGKE